MNSLEELKSIRDKMFDTVDMRNDDSEKTNNSEYKYQVLVCGGTGCTSSGSMTLIEEFEKQIDANGLHDDVKLVKTGCFGLCALGPVVIVYPEGAFYSMVKAEDVREIVEQHLKGGNVVTRLLYEESVHAGTDEIKSLNEIDFYKKQHRVALRN